MFRNTEKALQGLGFLIRNYEGYRLRLSYDDEANPSLGLYRVSRNLYGIEGFDFVRHIDTTDLLEQVAGLEDEGVIEDAE